jgi:hypothetical protein
MGIEEMTGTQMSRHANNTEDPDRMRYTGLFSILKGQCLKGALEEERSMNFTESHVFVLMQYLVRRAEN